MTNEVVRVSLAQEETAVFTDFDTVDDHFREFYAHFVEPDEVFRNLLAGLPVTAFCGYTWMAKRFIDNGELPLCPDCQEAYAARGCA
jgi:Protein of unknown function (DUF3039)